jgi:hypothetical protein
MNADALLEGEYIKAVELDGVKLPTNPTYTIKSIEIESLPNLKKPGKEINKGVVSFREIERGWVMNRTNVECLKALFGGETQGWVGKRVTLGVEPTKTGPGIRVVGSPDIEREVVAEWTPPRQRKVSKKMVPTGRPATGGGNRQAPRSEHDNFLDALATEAGYNREHIAAFLAAQGLVVTDRATGEALWPRLQEGGDLAEMFNAGPAEGGTS